MKHIKEILRDMPTFFLAYLVVAVPFMCYAVGTMLTKAGVTNIAITLTLLGAGFVVARLLKKWASKP